MDGVTAPGALELVERFVNTLEIDEDADELGSPEALGAWLAANDLAPAGVAWTQADLDRVVDLRECLRELLLANSGGPPDPATVASVVALGREAPLAVTVDAEGRTRLEPVGDGVEAVLGRLLAIVAEAQAAGAWSRMKACLADDCHWAFYDGSRNRSRTWCSMSVCGNRAKARSYRARARHDLSAQGAA
jgi:predicted RNA-binding Zn ribbon-like protein